MSLEIAIQENTTAVKALTAALVGMGAKGAAPAEKPAKTSAPAAEKAEDKPVKLPKKTESAKVPTTFEELATEFKALGLAKGRTVAMAVLRDLGVPEDKKLSFITEDKYAEASAAIRKAMAAE